MLMFYFCLIYCKCPRKNDSFIAGDTCVSHIQILSDVEKITNQLEYLGVQLEKPEEFLDKNYIPEFVELEPHSFKYIT
jgi:hypothetical protein